MYQFADTADPSARDPMNRSMMAMARTASRTSPLAVRLLLLSALGILLSLLWDFSWESTVGIDVICSPPHLATYLSVALGGLVALSLGVANTRRIDERASAVRIGKCYAPLGAWVVAWGTCAFAGAMIFDRWWQSGYGLAAGIWHPPQIVKVSAFFAVFIGVMLFCSRHDFCFLIAGGLLLAMINVTSIALTYPNRQHTAAFYLFGCAVYPLALASVAVAGRSRFSATFAALFHLAVICLAVWSLPLVPAKPQAAPIYNALDHLMPPPFPLLLVAPAFTMDLLLRWFPGREQRFGNLRRAGESGLAFFVVFILVQWRFAQFLLTPSAENWFFAGGGRHWPFFLKIDAPSRVAFWKIGNDQLTLERGLAAAGCAILATWIGLSFGAWMRRLQR